MSGTEMGCLRGADLGEPNREVWEIGIRKLIQKTANQNGGWVSRRFVWNIGIAKGFEE